MRQSRIVCAALGVLAVVSCAFAGTTPAGTKFTYQGLLKSGGVPVNNNIDVRARLYDAEAGPDQVGSQIELLSVSCVDGVVTIPLDFGAIAFNGDARWLEIDVRAPAGGGTFTTLTPRQPITASPYSLQTRGIFVDDTGKVAVGATTGLLAKFQSLSTSFQLPAILGSNLDDIGGVGVLGASIGGTGVGVQAIAGSEMGESTAMLADNYSSEGTAIVANSLAEIGVAHGIRSIHRSTEGTAITAISLNGEGATQTIRAENNSEEGTAIAGIALGGVDIKGASAVGVYGESSSPNGVAIHGRVPAIAPASNLQTRAVWGENSAFEGIGVLGTGFGVNGVGVVGEGGPVGVSGHAFEEADVSSGVFGSGLDAGVRGTGGTVGVEGIGPIGVQGIPHSNGDVGVRGDVTVFGTVGVHGLAHGPGKIAVKGEATGSVIGNPAYDFFAAGSTSIDYGTSSSIRWKRNIEPIADSLGMLDQIQGVRFDWDEAHGGGHDIGCIAEEVGRVLPEIVGYEANGIDAHGMDYSKLTPLLVEAVKALRAEKDLQLADRDTQIHQLRAENIELQNRLLALETTVQKLLEGINGEN